MRTYLFAYGLALPVLFYIMPPAGFLLFVSIFFLMGIITCVKEYRDSVEKLKDELSGRIDDIIKEKNAIAQEIVESEDYISELRGKETMIMSLYEITKQMSEKLTFNEIFSVLSAFLKDNFDFKKSELLVLKDEGGQVKPGRVYKIEKDDSPDEDAANSDYSKIIEMFANDKKEIYISKEDGTNFAAIPLLSEDAFVGIITVYNLPRIDFEKFVIVATQFALEIKKVLLYETVEQLAITDSLTSLYTRRYFFERMSEEIGRSIRHALKFAFLMIDIDDFKRCNDTHGHMVGDVILKDVARIIKESIREIDLVGRYGGEEFCVILPETDGKPAKLVGERILKKIEESTFKAYDEKLKVTVSAGIAVYPDDSEDALDIIEKADKALYKAKNSGKNIICEYKP